MNGSPRTSSPDAQTAAYALVSGGGDSTAAALIAEQDPGFAGVVYIDTGTALPGVREHVDALAEKRGWPLIVLDSGDAYERLAAYVGLPGPGFHRLPFARLKERRLADLYRERGRVRLITGMRRYESVRRMGHVNKNRRARFRYERPINDYTTADVNAVLDRHGLCRSDVSALVGRSGECNCGAFAQDHEREFLCDLFPGFGDRLLRWEKIARNAGKWSVWGKRPPPKVPEDQTRLFLCEACSPPLTFADREKAA